MNNIDNELTHYWQQLKDRKFENRNFDKTLIMESINKESRLTINMLKKRFRIKIMWIVFFILCFSVWMLLSLANKELLMVLGILTLLYVISLAALLPRYSKMDQTIDMADNTLEVMRRNYKALKSMLSIERLFGVIGFPIALIAGSLISRIYKGYSLHETIHDEGLLRFLIIAILILVPIMYLSSELMNKKAFGKLKETLEKNIARMELLT